MPVVALALSAVFLLAQSLPFLAAHGAADAQHQFAGFLLNPTDGFSYLAKMRQGFDGAWRFTLPYTAEPGQGAAINMYYLLLGQLARWLGWSLSFTLHAARLLGAMALCAALYRLCVRTLPQHALWAYAWALFGSGLGWLAVLGGGLTSDFWVAEGYPFLASFANAHFPLGLALQIYLVTPTEAPQPGRWLMAAALLVLVYPFGWAVAVAVTLVACGLRRGWRAPASVQAWQAGSTLLGGLPYGLYALWVTHSHPVLAGWNAQNITPAPAPGDLLLSFAPAILLALPGVYLALKQRSLRLGVVAAWLLVGLVLVYLPFGLQRRFISGLYVPVVALAVAALAHWLRPTRLRLALTLLILLALPTNLFILLGAGQAAQTHEAALYMQADELAVYTWLQQHAPAKALVLAPADMGLRLPAFADVRVWYGHPFETVAVGQRKAELAAFYAGEQPLATFDADFVVRAHGQPANLPPSWRRLFASGPFEVWGDAP